MVPFTQTPRASAVLSGAPLQDALQGLSPPIHRLVHNACLGAYNEPSLFLPPQPDFRACPSPFHGLSDWVRNRVISLREARLSLSVALDSFP